MLVTSCYLPDSARLARTDSSAAVSDWRPCSTGSKRSPCFSIRSRTTSIVKLAGSSLSFTSSHRSGVETGAPSRGRTE